MPTKKPTIESIYPLSPMQQGILFHTLYTTSDSDIYFQQLRWIIKGNLNIAAFKRAWQFVVERHSVLRTLFVWKNRDKPLQVVREKVNLPWNEQDWRDLKQSEQQTQLKTFLQTDRKQALELNQAPLIRCSLFRLTEDTYQFIWNFHHIVMDGWSVPLILKEVFTYYEAQCQEVELFMEPSRPYQDYMIWLQKQDMTGAKQFWQNQLKDFLAPVSLKDWNHDKMISAKSAEKEVHLLKSTTETLQTLAQKNHLTLNTLVQGAWALLLSHYSGQHDIVFGATVSGRPTDLVGVESMVGVFINTLPVRVNLSENQTLISWLQQLQTQQFEREQYSYTPLFDIQSWSELPGGTPLFESILVFENYPIDISLQNISSHLTISDIQFFDPAKYPLTVLAIPDQELCLRINYDPSQFKETTISKILEHLQLLLEKMVANPTQNMGDFPKIEHEWHYQTSALKFHHNGFACQNIEKSLQYIKQSYDVTHISEIVFDELQDASVCLIETNNSTRLELVAGNRVKSFLNQGINLYHVCYEVPDILPTMEAWVEKGAIVISEPKPAPLFNHRLVAFLHTPLGLVELLEETKSSVSEKQMNRFEQSPSPKQTIAITATFTAEPLQESLDFWLQNLDMPFKLEFAPYNQVFQQLLDSSSLLSQNENGLNVVLVRVKDWIKSDNRTEVKTEIKQNIRDFVQTVEAANQRSANPSLVCLCPTSPLTPHYDLYQQMEEFLAAQLEAINGIYLVKISDVKKSYPVSQLYDPQSDQLGHIPYTPVFFTALGTMIARKIHAIKRNPYKVIVLDCDGTLWQGVCAEDGPLGVKIKQSHQFLQMFMIAQQVAGKLLCLCSKNQEKDVFAVFEQREEMSLKREHLVAWRINWQSKSINLKSLSEELNLGLESFIFVDDNPVECAEVQAHCPAVTVIQLPGDLNHIPQFLEHIWAFDQLKITSEDQQRTKLYQQNHQREHWRSKSLTFADFLAGLELEIKLSAMAPSQLKRVSQLTQRTNQFNLTTIRRTEAEIQQLCDSAEFECWVVAVKDRFGDYGLVGMMLFKDGIDAIIVDTFLLSCRALGRGVEHKMLAKLGEIAKERQLSWVEMRYSPTPKNQPVLNFLESVGGQLRQAVELDWQFKLPVELVVKLNYHATVENMPHSPESSAAHEDKMGQTEIPAPSTLFNRIATEWYDAKHILTVIESQKKNQKPQLVNAYVAPRNPVEEMLAGILREVLQLEQVGIYDNFFKLGGHSLLGVQVMSRIRETFAVDIPLHSLFDFPNVIGLSEQIQLVQHENKPFLTPPITPIARTDNLPLSFAQERLWFLEQLTPDNPFYNTPGAVRFVGKLNNVALEQSLREIIQRHETLRTNFQMVDGKPVPLIHPFPIRDYQVSRLDLQALPEAKQTIEVQRLVTEEAQRSFDLKHDTLLRATLLKLQANEHVLLVTIHHIVTDGWSMGVFIRDLSTLYEAFLTGNPSPLPKLPIQYVDFAHWQRQWLSGTVLEAQLSYWKQQLADAPPVLELPLDHPRPPVHTFQGATESFEITINLTQQLKSLSQQAGVTLFMTSLAAFAILLQRYTGQENIVIGSPIANRTHQEIEPLIGFFVNTLALCIDLSGNPNFLEVLKRVRQVTLGAYAHQDLPFEQLVEALQPERDLTRNPLIQVTLDFQNTPMPPLELKGLSLSPVEFESGTVRFDVEFFIWEENEKLLGRFCYYKDLFEVATIKRLLGHFQTLLAAITAKPKRSIFEYSILNETERHQLQVEWNNTQTDYPKDKCLHHLFEAQVAQTPDAIAVVFENQSLTYRELNNKTNQLAHYLDSLRVKPEVLVGLCIERSLEMVIGLLGILKAGGAYVPLDPSYPPERVAFMLEDSQVLVLLTQQKLKAQLPESKAQVLCLDSHWKVISQMSTKNPVKRIQSDNLAYVIYTSGSTGKPKGVQITHQALTNFLNTMRFLPGLTDQDVWLAVTTVSFDIAALELYLPLMVGAKIVLVSREVASDGVQLLDVLNHANITVMQATPATWRLLLMSGWAGTSHLKILIGGEALPRNLAGQLLDKGAQVWNLYGPTETTIWSTRYQINSSSLAALDFESSESIGYPIANTEIYLVDSNYQLVPVGVPGELYIGGDGLARGYLNRQELTAEKFIPNSFSTQPGTRLYKTGDLVRYLPDGKLEYLSRIDNQVKIRGFRIELGEIEAVLNQHAMVQQTVVICTETQSNDKRLIAYLVFDLEKQAQFLDESKQEVYAEQISQWEHIWHENYNQAMTSQDATFNIAGWNSSYTGLPIPEAEMREWVNSTVDTILSLQPNSVLEIGCGTGLLLSRIAPHCHQYWGTDFSTVVLQQVEQLKSTVDSLEHVMLFNRKADDFSDIKPETFDTIILNSVIQYFPSVTYLFEVLGKAIQTLKPGGSIFIGDVRNLALLKAYHASVQFYQAPASLTCSKLQQRIQQRMVQEEELVIAPTFFTALTQHFPNLTHVQIQLKPGHYHNELTRFRYDVILQVGSPVSQPSDITWQDWSNHSWTLSTLRQHLIETQPDIIGLRQVPNARLDKEIKILEWLTNAASTETVAQLRQIFSKSPATGIEPEKLGALSEELSYDVVMSWAHAGADGSYDVILQHRGVRQKTRQGVFFPFYDSEHFESKSKKSWHHYANNPLQGKLSRKLVPQLRQFLQEQLPDYMVPSAFVMLDSIPLTPNGKIDRRALLALETFQSSNQADYVAPRTFTEESLANIWIEILGLERIGIHDNFFEVGGHSLLATQLMSRIANTFSIELPLRHLFESPTVATLAEKLEKIKNTLQKLQAPLNSSSDIEEIEL